MRIFRKNIIKIGLLSLLIFNLACSDSLTEINVNPNSLSDTEVDIKFVLTDVLSSSAQIQDLLAYDWGELSAATQYLQRDFTSYEENNYQWSPVNYNNFYSPLKNAQYIYERAEIEKDGEVKNYYQAVALIMKAYGFGFLTSAFGDVPFSEALMGENGGEAFQPSYDAQRDVFLGILADLERANELLNSAGVISEVSDADIVYGGDSQKWRRFANSLRLRFYMRLSEKEEINAQAGFANIVQNNLPLLEDNTDNAAVSYVGTDANNSWPGGALNWSNRSEFYRRKPSSTIVNDLIALQDPRLTKWVAPVDVQLTQGTENSLIIENGRLRRYVDLDIQALNIDSNLENDLNTSLFVGLPVALSAPNDFNMGAATLNDFGDAIASLAPNVYLAAAANPHSSYLTPMYSENTNDLVKAVFMNAAEVEFLLAEASVRGWIADNEYDHYENGIQLSFDQYEIYDGDQNAVYNLAEDQLVAFNETLYLENARQILADAADPLQAIIHQKWIALWLTYESWFDWRRTGYPNLNQNIISGTRGQNTPLRFIYSDAYNEANMLDAVNTGLSPAENDQWSQMWLLQ
ncbi:SusD/RagB family nutrient-binding outer membrane lipoprotein [Zunongwangia atlantica]|uniref:SusD/RagB family nutrient-binding outer membrane lipoprotein n=1 Tax=Zunongwangia atlantica 22II14-10F7 TaxID=1185767 RepID=A0A1Y1T6Z3_9FLAO|nr:SusD/RagB family nutrient-binding outer membrane lipoprotein [Zunongwangia atlantica]ORL46816.1 hypothetical protein IIF7_04831 [Zunongwangia atlantica 22II14-10F7]